jgi:hypothetical protein
MGGLRRVRQSAAAFIVAGCVSSNACAKSDPYVNPDCAISLTEYPGVGKADGALDIVGPGCRPLPDLPAGCSDCDCIASAICATVTGVGETCVYDAGTYNIACYNQ